MTHVKKQEQGVSLIMTFFIMVIILSIILSVTIILYSEIKVIQNIGNSMVGFYAADSGVEKVLYYDYKILDYVEGEDPLVAERGLCLMFDTRSDKNCITGTGSVYCNNYSTEGSCDPQACYDCTIRFSTDFDATSNGEKYSVVATVASSTSSSAVNFTLESKGFFGTASRQVQLYMSTPDE
jgi:hypothetical protein